jgi:peroxiredoxin Q/BCP
MLNQGKKAPTFELSNESGETISLNQFKGKKVVLYFYPKDNTPGCTKEACHFRDNYDVILKKGAVVIGISADSTKSHINFKNKHNLPFYLLSDTEKQVIKAYQAWGEKKMYGKTYFGIIRSTYIIDEQGMIIKIFPRVKPDEHVEEVLAAL